MSIPGLHLVTDDEVLADPTFPARAEAVMEAHGGRVALHVRGPRTGGNVLHGITRRLMEVSPDGAHVFVNDRVDVAMACSAHGVHLGRRSIDPASARALLDAGVLVGVSCHDEDEVEAALRGGADYLFAGPVFATPSHPESDGLGREGFAGLAARAEPVPTLAIGGVTPERVGELLSAGGHGVAIVRGVWRAPDPVGATEAYLNAIEEAIE